MLSTIVQAEPGILIATVTVIGGIFGALITAAVTKRKDSAALALDIAREAREDVKELRTRLDVVEEKLSNETAKHSKTQKNLRVMTEKYHAAMKWIAIVITAWEGLRARLVKAGFPHGEIPRLPMLLEEDFSTMTNVNNVEEN